MGKRNHNGDQWIDLYDDCTLWDQTETVKLIYEKGNDAFDSLKHIVSLETIVKDKKQRLEHFFFRFVKSYYKKMKEYEGDGEEIFLDKNFIRKEKRKITLILVFERLRTNKVACANFHKAYKKNPKGGLSKVPKCLHAWKFSAQEAAYLLSICTDRARSAKKALRPLCLKAVEELLSERYQKPKCNNTSVSKLFTALRALESLGLLGEIDLDDIKENGVDGGTDSNTFFAPNFIDLCNEIVFMEEEEEEA